MPHSLQTEVVEIAGDLIEAFGLTFVEEEATLADPLIRWLDYRLRYIDPRARGTLRSIDFDARVPGDARSALDAFIASSESGSDLNPYQTKTIKRNDTSATKRQLRTDGLWADWGIHHAHLTETPLAAGAEFSDRSEWLLFFMVLPDHLALIDVRSHNEPDVFQAFDLVEKAIRSWPNIADGCRVRGVGGLAHSPATDPKSVKELRKGVTQFIEVDGSVYMPLGMGVTTAATSTRVSRQAIRAKSLARDIGDHFARPESPIMKAALAQNVSDPALSLQVLPDGRLAIGCARPSVVAPFPMPPLPGDARAELEDMLLPAWAGAKLVDHLTAKHSGTP